uniref:DBF4-type domain-containing protein n=1 Tax=Picocystis salinarum TaxID=88271 RepID=A0A7S3XDS9_9CHLO|mmetsp:Transcript_7914/g.48888  ORF Transcript_7914/g.48888 Transcript_7914/m.48888 type:complete len:466 (+) Transcript_7914:88-1485(+)
MAEEGRRDGERRAKEARCLPVLFETRRGMDVHGDGKRPAKCTKNRDKKRCRNAAFDGKEDDGCIRKLRGIDRMNVRFRGQDGYAVHPGRPGPKANNPPEMDERSNRKQRQAVYFLDLHEKHELEMAKKVLSKSNRPTRIAYTLNKDVTHILTRDERSWKNKQNDASSTQEIKGSGRASKLAKVATEQVKELPRGLTHAEICARYGMKIVRFEQIEKQSKKLDLEERLALEKKEATPNLPVLMIEDLSGKFKPIVKEIPRTKDGRMGLPYLDFDAAPGTCPFVFPEKNGNGSKSKPSRRKQREPDGIKKKRDSQENKRLKWRVSRAGYCEVCSVSFEEYSKHVERPEHIQRKRKDPTNKLLDNLFASFGAPAAMPLVFDSPIQRTNDRPTKAVLTDSPPVSKIGSSTKIESTLQENRGMYKLRRKMVTRSSDRAAHGRITRNAHQKQTGAGMLLRGHRRPLAAVNQ